MQSDQSRLAAERALGHGWGAVQPDRHAAVRSLGTSSVLDVGCSSAAYVHQVCEQGGAGAGVDVLIDRSWAGSPLPFVNADARYLPFASRSFDAIVAFETLEHVADPQAALVEWARVTRQHLVVSVPNGESPYWSRTAGLTYRHFVDRTHVNIFTAQDLAKELESAGFAVDALDPILPINPFVPALDAAGLPPWLVERVGRRLTRLARQRRYAGQLAMARLR